VSIISESRFGYNQGIIPIDLIVLLCATRFTVRDLLFFTYIPHWNWFVGCFLCYLGASELTICLKNPLIFDCWSKRGIGRVVILVIRCVRVC